MLLNFHKVNWAAKEQHHPCSCEPSPNRGAKAEISWFCFLLFFLSAVGYGYEFTNGSFLSSDSSGQLISRFLSKRSCQGPQKFRQVSNLVKCHMLSLANPVPSFLLLCSLPLLPLLPLLRLSPEIDGSTAPMDLLPMPSATEVNAALLTLWMDMDKILHSWYLLGSVNPQNKKRKNSSNNGTVMGAIYESWCSKISVLPGFLTNWRSRNPETA